MRLGIVAYAENTGLGNLSKSFYDNLEPYKTLLLDRSGSRGNDFFPDRYKDFGNVVIVNGLPTLSECDEFIQDLDIILIFEVSPSSYLLDICRKNKVATVLMPMFEYYKSTDGRFKADYIIAPSPWHYKEYPEPKTYLPVPITIAGNTGLTGKIVNFLHIAGRPIYPDRNGTYAVLDSLLYVKKRINLTIRCQRPEYMVNLLEQYKSNIPPNVTVTLDSVDYKDLNDLYTDQDVLLMPRRFGGLCMPVNEAIGHGLPVVMTDISPNNHWLPQSWLIPAVSSGKRKTIKVNIWDPDVAALANKIDWFANPLVTQSDKLEAAELAERNSWRVLKPKYMQLLEPLCYHKS